MHQIAGCSLAIAAATACLRAQVLSSQASVSPAITFDLFEFHPLVSPPVTQSGSVNANTVLWPLTALPAPPVSGAPSIQITHPGGSSIASFTYSMQGTPNGDELVLQLEWRGRTWDNPPSPFGFYGIAAAQGGCLIHVNSVPAQTCGVLVTASLDANQAPDAGAVAVDIGNDGVFELQGGIQGPVMHADLAAWRRVPLRGGLLPIHVGAHAHAESDGGHHTCTVHVEIRISPDYAASIGAFGAGCSAGAWTPSLGPQGNSLPQLGTTFALEVGNLPPEPHFVVGFLATDASTWLGQPLPLDLGALGMPGCLLHIAPLGGLAYPLLSTGGSAAWPLVIPATQSLLGLQFFMQALVEAAGANAFGAVTTNACHGVMGA